VNAKKRIQFFLTIYNSVHISRSVYSKNLFSPTWRNGAEKCRFNSGEEISSHMHTEKKKYTKVYTKFAPFIDILCCFLSQSIH